MKKNTILLLAGAVITLLFIIFATSLFESLFYEREFSNEMYSANLYFIVAIVTALIAWAFAGIYYYVINLVSFSRWYHWLIVLIAAMIVAPVINYTYPSGVFSADGLDFSAQLFSFCLVDVAVTAVLFVIASFSIRWWSSNCRHTPIPE